MTRPRALALLVTGILLVAGGPPTTRSAAAQPAPVAVQGSVASGAAVLGNGVVERRWAFTAGQATTSSWRDLVTGRQWALPRSEDFSLTVDGRTVGPASGLTLVEARAGSVAVDRARPGAAGGRQVVLRFRLDAPRVEVTRSYALFPGSAVMAVGTTVRNESGSTVQLGDHALEQLDTPLGGEAEVRALQAGATYQLEHLQLHRERAGFDHEGEILRVDDGRGAGIFLINGRRSAPSTRAGRSPVAGGWRTWVGAQPQRELGMAPILIVRPQSQSNRILNPLWPIAGHVRRIGPGNQVDLGRAWLGAYHGGADAAPAAWVRELQEHVMPPLPGDVQQNTFHPFPDGEDSNERAMATVADAAKAVGVETLVLDDGWQGGPGGLAGDWRMDPARYPDRDGDGVVDFAERLERQGIRLGLWMQLALFHRDSDAFRQHPQWACAPLGLVGAAVEDYNGLGFWDLNQPQLRAHLLSAVDRILAQTHARELKLDNMTWMGCVGHDFEDMHDAWLSLVREIQRRHPDVVLQSDETVDMRTWPFESAAIGPSWFEDDHLHDGVGLVANHLYDLWSQAPWMPLSLVGLPALHDLPDGVSVRDVMPIELLARTTFWADLRKLGRDAAEVRWWLRYRAEHRQALTGISYPLTDESPLGEGWTVLQAGDGREVHLVAARQQAPAAIRTVRLRRLDPQLRYAVRDVRSGQALGEWSGAELMGPGLRVRIDRVGATRMLAVVAAPEPSGRRPCSSTRRVTIHLGTGGRRVRSAHATVNGRRVPTRIVGRNGVRIAFDGRGPGRVRVRVQARTVDGRGHATTRRYRLCRPGRR